MAIGFLTPARAALMAADHAIASAINREGHPGNALTSTDTAAW